MSAAIIRLLITGTIGMFTRKGDQQDYQAKEMDKWKNQNEKPKNPDIEHPPPEFRPPKRGPDQYPEPF